MYLPLTIDTSNKLRNTIRQYYRADETAVIEELLPLAQLDHTAQERASQKAIELAGQIRHTAQKGGNIQNLLNQYALSTDEGIVLMCLAEALLRVPDSITADRLIRDKLLTGNWSSHIGGSDSFFVNASSWGLLLSGRVVSFNNEDAQDHINSLKKSIGRLGEPVIRQAMRQAMGIMGTQFVLGRTIAEAGKHAQKQEAIGYRYSYDMLGEAARTMKDANTYFDSYKAAIEHIGTFNKPTGSKDQGVYDGAGISVKLSAIHPRYEFIKSERVMDELVTRLNALAIMAKDRNLGLTIDAEEADRLELSLDIIEAVFTNPALASWEGFGIVVQAYQKRALHVLHWAIDLSRKAGKKMMLRLVKGAYWDSEIKVAQIDGLESYPVFTRKASTDLSYQACAGLLLDNRNLIFPQFATHNAYSVAYVLERAGDDFSGFEFQRLHGMGDGLYDNIMQEQKIPVRIYAPVGEHKSLLAYLVRRLLENGANSSFVNNIVDDNVPLSELVEDPVEKMKRWSQINNPHIAMPNAIYGDERVNSKGIDLTDIPRVQQLAAATQAWETEHIKRDLTFADGMTASTSPSDTRDILGFVPRTSIEQLESKLVAADNAYKNWSVTTAQHRAALLERLADKLELHMDELIALCTKEAGKITADGIAEVREAVDFCRYYANQGQRVFSPHPQWAEQGQLVSRGVVLCISPWNFPLAIFLGQVTAALAAGNSVLAKPADSTCLIASRAVELMKDCGFPNNLVQLILTPGKVVGEHLLPDKRIAAVMFTGSTDVGAWISKKLAQRPGPRIPLIAETGGQNCLIVDSTALPEQVVDDVIASGFQSAGQRCSALRVLFLQEDIADNIIQMVTGAMKELQVGDPAYLRTDIGPVIDQKSLSTLNSHLDFMQHHINEDKAKLLYQCALPDECSHGTFFAPRLYEIDSIKLLKQEVFGPVVHVVRYQADQFDQALADINSTGLGLTSGVHSRIQTTADKVVRTIDAGNIYINRNTIGAVVGVQPFGGHGLSGTGPKAGGPSYVYRLTQQASNSFSTKGDLNFTFSNGDSLQPNLADNLPPSLTESPFTNPVNIQQRIHQVHTFTNALIKENPLGLSGSIIQHLNAMSEEVLATHSQATTLPGPTGELNQLLYEARGKLICLHQGEKNIDDATQQLLAALLTGNQVLHISDSPIDITPFIEQAGLNNRYQRILVSSENSLSQLLLCKSLKGVAISGPDALLHWADKTLAKRDGPLLPLITETAGPTLLPRFVLEKVISNNTTASGGNTYLLAMSDE